MKKILVYIIILVFTTGFGYVANAQLALQCPSCTPVQGCDQCWATVTEAQNNGCSSAARSAAYLITPEGEQATQQVLTSTDWQHVIYPNPSYDGYFTLESAQGFTGEVFVADLLGKRVSTYRMHGERLLRFTQKLLPGIYIMTMTDHEGKKATKKLIVH